MGGEESEVSLKCVHDACYSSVPSLMLSRTSDEIIIPILRSRPVQGVRPCATRRLSMTIMSPSSSLTSVVHASWTYR